MKEDTTWQRYWRYLTARFRGEVDDEIAFHIEMRARELEHQGLPPDQALGEARRRFGDQMEIRSTLQRIEEKRGRRMNLSFLLSELGQDIRYGVRGLLKRPGFTLMTASSLAMGIATTTVVLSIIDAFLLRPLAARKPSELVVIGSGTKAGGPLVAGLIGLPTVRELATRTDLFQGVSATWSIIAAARPTESDPAERGIYLAVTGNYFSMLGVSPVVGRMLTADDDDRRERVVVLGNREWRSRFGGDANIVGKTIRINTVPFVIVGVSPAAFQGTEHIFDPVGFVPLGTRIALDPASTGWESVRQAGLTVVARRQPNRSMAEIGSAIGTMARDIEKAHPEVGEQYRLVAYPESRARPNLPSAGTMVPVAVALALMSLLVLTTAAVNATNLILARGTTRATELAVRQALGASRGRLVSQLLTETLLVALVGLIGGLGLARLAIKAMTSIPLRFNGLSLNWGPQLDARVFAMAAAVTVVVGLIAGLGPALSASSFQLQQRLREGGRAGLSPRGRRARSALVVAQVAASVVVLATAGLFLTSARQAQKVDPGFPVDHLLNFGVDASLAHYDKATTLAALDRIQRAVAEVPGVRSVAWSNAVPIKQGTDGLSDLRADGDTPVGAFHAAVAPGYFATIGIPILEGRDFALTDDTAHARVVIINQRAAEALWPGKSAVGRMVRLERDAPPVEVVGVARDSRYLVLTESPRAFFYRPLAQVYGAGVFLNVRTTVEPGSLVGPIGSAVARADRDLAPFDIQTMKEILDTHPNGTLVMWVGAAFAASIGFLALVLTLVGLYGVIAFSVAQRTREIGVRIALGATWWTVVRSVLFDGGKLAFGGIGIGLVLAVLIGRLMGGLLVGNRADLLIYTAVATGLALAALVSAYLPARRAARIDPVKALSEG